MLKKIRSLLKLKKRYFVILAAIILAGGWFFFFSRTSSQPQLQFAEVKRQNLKSTVSASGIYTGKNATDLHFKSGGKLSYISVKAGDQVFAGETLAGLDTEDLSINLQQAQNNLRDKQATVDKILDDIHLFQYGNSGTTGETETQKQLRTSAETSRDNAFDNVKAAQRAFQDSIITSPISGLITKSDFLPGMVVSPADVMVQVVDFTTSVFAADIDESDVAKVTVGQKAEVTLNAYGDKIFPGIVSEVTTKTKNASNGATVVTVKIALSDSSIQKIAGLNGQASIIIAERVNTLSVPAESLQNGNTVLVQTLQGLKQQKIETGLQTDTDVEVNSGLNEGDKVVINP